MTEQTATTTVKATVTPQQQYTAVGLRSPDGARLEVYVRRVKTGGALAGVDHATAKNGDGRRTHTRGATSTHATWEEAIQQRDRLAAQAIKAGWTRPTGPAPGARKADAFDANHLPAPAAPKPAGKK